MNAPQAIVRCALALHLRIDPEAIDETQRIGRDLGLDPFDLVLVGMRLEEVMQSRVEFPKDRLEGVETVRDLVDIVRRWTHASRGTPSSPSLSPLETGDRSSVV